MDWGFSPMFRFSRPAEKWHTRHSQSCRSACSSTSSRTIGSLRGKLRQQKKQQDIVVSEWIYISFTLKFGHLNMKSDHELVDGTGTHTCPLKAAVLERIPQASPFKILSCKEPTKVLLSPSKSKIQRSDRASLADKALQSLQGLRRRHPSAQLVWRWNVKPCWNHPFLVWSCLWSKLIKVSIFWDGGMGQNDWPRFLWWS